MQSRRFRGTSAAADAGDADAQFRLGVCSPMDNGVAKDAGGRRCRGTGVQLTQATQQRSSNSSISNGVAEDAVVSCCRSTVSKAVILD